MVLQIFSKLLKFCLQFISKWAKEMVFSNGAVVQGIAINGKLESSKWHKVVLHNEN